MDIFHAALGATLTNKPGQSGSHWDWERYYELPVEAAALIDLIGRVSTRVARAWTFLATLRPEGRPAHANP